MKPLFLFEENDRVLICKLRIGEEKRAPLRDLGVCEGRAAEIFLKDPQKMILKLDRGKIALSEQIALNILAAPVNVP